MDSIKLIHFNQLAEHVSRGIIPRQEWESQKHKELCDYEAKVPGSLSSKQLDFIFYKYNPQSITVLADFVSNSDNEIMPNKNVLLRFNSSVYVDAILKNDEILYKGDNWAIRIIIKNINHKFNINDEFACFENNILIGKGKIKSI